MQILISPSTDFRFSFQNAFEERPHLLHAFKESRAKGLLHLVNQPASRNTSPSLSFWFEYTQIFMRALCAYADTEPLHIPVEIQTMQQLAGRAPLTAGSEYITTDLLIELWQELAGEVIMACQSFRGTPRQYIASYFPDWADVGKVHFHLAENRRNAGGPFAFLATYTVRIADKARVQHRPLGLALRDSLEHTANQQGTKHLEQLLRPVYEAAKKSMFLQAALNHKRIYSTLYLEPDDAYRFIKDIPVYEAAGIICRLPEWWQKGHPPRAKVKVSIGSTSTKQSHVGFDQMLGFNIGVAIGGEELSQEEIDRLIWAQGPLVQLNGRWIEVDQQRLQRMLDTWNQAVETAQQGEMSFSQAMRLFTGFDQLPSAKNAEAPPQESLDQEWLSVAPQSDLKKLLTTLRTPESDCPAHIQDILNRHLMGTLRPYQLAGLNWLHQLTQLQLGGCLADDMGLGKTIQVIAMLLVQKHGSKAHSPNLLIVPASLLGNWSAEIQRFAPSLEVKILHSSMSSALDKEHAPADLQKYDLIITTYGMAVRSNWLSMVKWRIVIADEAQAIKNHQTKQAKALRSLKAYTKIAMTGTPVENHLGDLWSIFNFACPGLLGNEARFKEAVKVMQTAESGGPDYAPLRQLIAPYILRRKKTDKSVISDLPDKIEMTAECLLTKKQAALYQKEVDRLINSITELEESKAKDIDRKGLVLGSLMRFKQICNHPSQYLHDSLYEPHHSGKFQKLLELAEVIASRQEKVLVFTQFRELTDILAHLLATPFGQSGLMLHGGTAVNQRQSLVEQFQDPAGPPFMILSLKAGGTGLNLTAASHVIHFDRWWNPAVENQATDRAFRIGQKRNVLVHKFVCKGTIEEKIDTMIKDKQSLANTLVDNGADLNITELSNEELIKLIALDINTVGVDS